MTLESEDWNQEYNAQKAVNDFINDQLHWMYLRTAWAYGGLDHLTSLTYCLYEAGLEAQRMEKIRFEGLWYNRLRRWWAAKLDRLGHRLCNCDNDWDDEA